MEDTFMRIFDVVNSVRSEDLVELGRLSDGAFTRDRKLTFENLVWLILNKHGLSAAIELYAFFQRRETEGVTKQSFSKARLNLNPEVFKVLNSLFIQSYYDGEEVETFNGFKVFAVDGCVQDLVNDDRLKEEFGGVTDKKGEIVKAKARTSGILDVNTHFMIDYQIAPYKTSEVDLAKNNINNLLGLFSCDDVLLIFDRGYPSIEFFYYLIKKGVKFLFRIEEDSYKSEKRRMKSNDEFVDIELNESRLKSIKDKKIKNMLCEKGSLRLRVTKIKLDNGKREDLISNLCLDEINSDDLKVLYSRRWEIEKSFDVLKNKLYIENISGYSRIAVEQDFHAQILVYNMVQDIKNEGDKILEEKRRQKERQEMMYGSLKKERKL